MIVTSIDLLVRPSGPALRPWCPKGYLIGRTDHYGLFLGETRDVIRHNDKVVGTVLPVNDIIGKQGLGPEAKPLENLYGALLFSGHPGHHFLEALLSGQREYFISKQSPEPQPAQGRTYQ